MTPNAPLSAAPMMGDNETPDDTAQETAAPTLEVSGPLAAALTDGKQQGDEFSATVKFRVGELGEGGEASLEVLDAVPQDDGGGADDSGAAVDSYLAAKGAPPPAQ
jgi:hypothetical protein